MNYITKKDLLKCYRDGILVPEQDGKQWTQLIIRFVILLKARNYC